MHEAAVLGLTGEIVGSLSRGAGVRIVQEGVSAFTFSLSPEHGRGPDDGLVQHKGEGFR